MWSKGKRTCLPISQNHPEARTSTLMRSWSPHFANFTCWHGTFFASQGTGKLGFCPFLTIGMAHQYSCRTAPTYPSYFRSHTVSSLWGFTLGCLFWSQMALPFLLISTALLLSFFLVVSLWREINCLLKLFIVLCLDDWWTFTKPWSSAS